MKAPEREERREVKKKKEKHSHKMSGTG